VAQENRFDLDQVLLQQGIAVEAPPENWSDIQDDLESNARRRGFVMVGLGILGGVTVLGTMGWMLERQLAKGDVFRMRLEHSLDPGDRNLLQALAPDIRKVASQGLGMRLSSRAERKLARARAELELEALSQDE
jgi:hypothetical protein